MSQPMTPHRQRMLSIDPACIYCRLPLTVETATIDHVLPLSRGGDNSAANLVLACRWCNCSKGNMTPLEWLDAIRGKRAKRVHVPADPVPRPCYQAFESAEPSRALGRHAKKVRKTKRHWTGAGCWGSMRLREA